jgi:molybdate transport system substrate-binding protein
VNPGAAAVAALALVLSGCAAGAGDGGGDGQGTELADPVAGTITVFAAASLTEVFGELETAFEQRHPSADVVLNFGGSGALATQITAGAPADVFAAASEEPMTTVADAADADPPSIFATNTLELVVPAGNPGGVTALDDLADPGLAVALCDPSVPCGAATVAVLRHAEVVAAPDTLEEDVRAVLTKIELGEADAGLVYLTDVVAAAGSVEGIVVPEAADVVSRYPIAVMSAAPNPEGARAWAAFVLSADGRAALAAAGFGSP